MPVLRCPLCRSVLSRQTYERVVGVWDARKTSEDELRKKVADLREAKRQLNLERKRLARDMRQKLKDAGAPIEAVSRALRHSSVATTEKYYARIRSEKLGTFCREPGKRRLSRHSIPAD